MLEDDGAGIKKMLANKTRTFWMFQTVGWTGYFLFRLFVSVANSIEMLDYLPLAITATFMGVGLTIVMRYIYRVVRRFSIQTMILAGLFISTVLGLVQSAATLQVMSLPIVGFGTYTGLGLFANGMVEALTLLAWSGLYFGFHFLADLQSERERALKAIAMAHQAQLKMLRYQLNPHFLFNTLNAISTLVMERDSTGANKMVTKLSSFLRYTLINQPTQRTTLKQELYAIGLYLDIEKVRFEERLEIKQAITDGARQGLIPSLLLQPLIENAIKYAVAPSETGGTIFIGARVNTMSDELVLTVSDDGPGIEDLSNPALQTKSSGVGIANTRDRLQQVYGSKHEVKLINRAEGGLKITIVIPYEKSDISE